MCQWTPPREKGPIQAWQVASDPWADESSWPETAQQHEMLKDHSDMAG